MATMTWDRPAWGGAAYQRRFQDYDRWNKLAGKYMKRYGDLISGGMDEFGRDPANESLFWDQVGRGKTDIKRNYGQQEDELNRNMARYGIDPGSGKGISLFGQLLRDKSVDLSQNFANAGDWWRNQVGDHYNSLVSGYSNMLSQLFGQSNAIANRGNDVGVYSEVGPGMYNYRTAQTMARMGRAY